MPPLFRWLIAPGALLAALLVAFIAAQPPRPKLATAPAAEFSAARAMTDIVRIARAPRPTGSAENARVRAYLGDRMRALGMTAGTQAEPLPENGAERLGKWTGRSADGTQLTNLIGVLAGRDAAKPALLLMAHHDSVWASPGAADDAAGVASALEIVRALKVRGTPERDVIVLLTDAEELGLDGAEAFFERHPLARRVGAVINMEARGSGGRAAMFETGRRNGAMVDLYRASVDRPFSNSLAVLVYELMPNNTDFTIPKTLGIPGFNFAFIGRAGLYHSPMADVDALEPGALQDIGAQALAVAAALAFADRLPAPAPDAVFGDVLGLLVISYAPSVGWAVLALAAGLLGFAWVRARAEAAVSRSQLLGGLALALTLLLHMALLLKVGNLLSGGGGATNYYDRLASLPRLELQAFFLCVAALLAASVWVAPKRRMIAAVPAMLVTGLGMLAGGWFATLGLGLAAAISALILPRSEVGVWGGWLGFQIIALLLALAVQIAAPTAAPAVAWPLLAAAVAAALAAALDPRFQRVPVLVAIALIAAIGGGQMLNLAHFTFLGVGAPMPEVVAVHGWLIAMLLWPLLRVSAQPRLFRAAAALSLVAAAGIALSVRLDPIADTIPPYSERR